MNLEEIFPFLVFDINIISHSFTKSIVFSLTHPFMGDAHPSETTCNHSMSKVEISTLGREEASANAASFLSPSTKSSVTLSLAELGMMP